MISESPISSAPISATGEQNSSGIGSAAGVATVLGIGVPPRSDAKIINCFAWENGGDGIVVGRHNAPKILNCTSADNTGDGIEVSATTANAEVKNCIAYGNSTEINDLGYLTVQVTNFTTNPTFTDAANDDYSLNSESPAIDTGTDLSSEGFSNDYSGAPRPGGVSTQWDIGAYEYQSESAPPPNEGAGSSAGVGSASGVGILLATASAGTADGIATVAGVGEFVNSEGAGQANGIATVIGRGQFSYGVPGSGVPAAINPKSYTIRLTEVAIGANGLIELFGVPEDISLFRGTGDTPFIGEAILGGTPVPVIVEPEDGTDQSTPGSTRVVMLDIPLLQPSHSDPGFYVAASGIHEQWTGAVLYEQNGENFSQVASFSDRSGIGMVSAALPSGSVTLFNGSGRTYQYDDANTITVEFNNPLVALVSVTEAQQEAGQNAAAIGAHGRWEIISYGTATQTGETTWQLSHLLRGLKGTEHNIGTHQPGDVFVTISDALRRVSDSYEDIGVSRQFRAVSFGDQLSSSGSFSFTNTGISSKPLSGVYIRGDEDAANSKNIQWWRRSRTNGLAGREGTTDPPLGEASEHYEIDILQTPGGTLKRTLTSTTQNVIYSAAHQIADFGSVQTTVHVCIYQMSGELGRGYPYCASLSTFGSGTFPIFTVPYVIAASWPGRPRGVNAEVGHPPLYFVTAPADFAGSRGEANTAATASTVFSITKNGTQIGTCTFAPSATKGTFSTSGAVIALDTSDVIDFVPPASPDNTLARVRIALLFFREEIP